MYHPGKVLDIFSHKDKDVESSDSSTQVTLEMWDENQLTLIVDPKLEGKIKEGDIVLVDYRPSSDRIPIPKHIVIKIIKNKKAKKLWITYKSHHEKKKKMTQTASPPMPGYVG